MSSMAELASRIFQNCGSAGIRKYLVLELSGSLQRLFWKQYTYIAPGPITVEVSSRLLQYDKHKV
jgi:hypothetical protein